MQLLAHLGEGVVEVCVFVLAVLAFSRGISKQQFIAAGMTGSGGGGGDFTNMYNNIKQALPDGQAVKCADLAKQLGVNAGNLLPWAKPDTITRTGDHYKLVSLAQTSQKLGKAEIRVQKLVECDCKVVGGDLVVTNIEVIQVSASASAPFLDLKEVTVSKLANGNTTITARVQVNSWLPYVTRTITLGPDGKPIP